MDNNLGKNIKERREYLKMTMAELAEKIGVSQPYLSQIETGKRKASLKIQNALNEVLGLDLSDDEKTNDKKMIITGALLTTEIGVTEISFKITTSIIDKYSDASDDELKKVNGRYGFETSIIVNTITEFLEKNEEVLREEIINNLKEELDKLRNIYD